MENLGLMQGGFKNQPQQLMLNRGFSEFHIESLDEEGVPTQAV